MKEILGHLVEDEYFDFLMCENNKGKDIKVVGGKVVAEEHVQTEEEKLESELLELDSWFKWYDNQVAQYNRCQRLGTKFDKDIKKLDNQAAINQARIAEIREILKIN